MGKKDQAQVGAVREQFSSKFGLIAAAVGSAVGLGNIWRFPYIVGQYGGAAFLIIYLLFVAIIGIPLMVAEFIVGREGRSDAVNSYRNLEPDKAWHISGYIGVAASFFILAFYGVVAGWTLEYIRLALTNSFAGQSSDQIVNMFVEFTSHPIKPIITQILVMGLTGFIVSTGVQDGVEAAAKYLIPILVIIMIILNIQAFRIPGGKPGFEFLFKPDFSKLTGEGILAALGHAFFSLSLGMGIMVTYGSYIPDEENLLTTSMQVSIADTLLALLSGIAIFPAVFAFGIEPTSGAGLVFMSLPNVFGQMTGGYIFGILFFALLFLAALTSTISLMEASVAFVHENFKMDRKKATWITTAALIFIGMFASLSNGPLGHIKIFGDNIFDFLDNTTANFFLPSAALITTIYVGWFMNEKTRKNQITNNGTINEGFIVNVFTFLFKFVAPIAIVIVFLFQIGILG